MNTPKPKKPTVQTIKQYNVDFGDQLISLSGDDAKDETEALKIAQAQYDAQKSSKKE